MTHGFDADARVRSMESRGAGVWVGRNCYALRLRNRETELVGGYK